MDAVQAFVIIDDQGQWTSVALDEALTKLFGGSLALNRKRVKIVGERMSPEPIMGSGVQSTQAIQARSIALERPDGAAAATLEATPLAVTGSKPWVTILCRFADSTGVTPRDVGYINGLMGASYPGLDHYWREVSYQNINLTGSTVVGWYNLPQPKSYYVSSTGADLGKLTQDCTAVADADVYFPNFYGINLMFNDSLGCCAWGGSWWVSDGGGVAQSYGVTWMPPWGYENQSTMDHEMGHGFGLPHSSGPYSATYDSQWDPMSSTWRCSPADATYGCIGPHTISYHKDKLGWIPSSRKFVPSGSSQTITIERLGQPVSATNYLMAQIPIGGSSSQFYTVEARRFAGYDVNIPGEAIVIHNVDTTRSDRVAQVVDPDGNGNPNDAGAMWLPGETFTDSANQISVSVDAATASGFQVTITSSSPVISVTPASLDFGNVTVGSVADRTFTVQNTGTGTLTGSASTTAPFSIVSGGSYSLGAGASQTVTVRFSPTSATASTSNVTFTGGGGATRQVTGTGIPQSVTLTVTMRGSGPGTVTSAPAGITCTVPGTCVASYTSGTSVTLTASPGLVATFKQWGGACSGTATTCTVTLTANQSVTATFSQVFTDPTLTAGSTLIKAVHVIELRWAINTLQAVNGQAPFTWTDATLTAGTTPVKKVHLDELRGALAEAYIRAGRLPPSYTDRTLVAQQTVVKATHISELRNAVRALE